MARITYVKRASQRYETVPVLDENGEPKRTPVMRNGVQRTTRKGRLIFMAVTRPDVTKPLPPYTCEYCHEPIRVGTPYKHVSPKSGPYGGRKRTRHQDCPTWTRSELTSSTHRATVWSVVDDTSFPEPTLGEDDEGRPYFDADAYVSELQDVAAGAASDIREAVDSLNESADAMEDGLGHETSQSAELRERADALESAVDDLEGWSPSTDEPEVDPTDEDGTANWDSVLSWAQDLQSEIEDLLNECDSAVG